MKEHKTYNVKETKGRFFWEAVALPNSQRGICFVPDEFNKGGQFDERAYTNQRWASFNCAAVEAYGIGSHMFPNPEEPVLEETEEESARVEAFLKRDKRRRERTPQAVFKKPPMPRTIYKRYGVDGSFAVLGQQLFEANGSFFRKTYDLQAIAVDHKQSTEHEARMTERIREAMPDEKHFPDVLGYGQDYIETQLIPGKTLMSLLDLTPFSSPPNFQQGDLGYVSDAWATLLSADQKIRALHAKGYVHRDLHLDNIIMVKDGAGIEAALIDFEKSEKLSKDESKAQRDKDYDRRFILQAALLIGFKVMECQEDALFQEAFEARRALFREFSGMTLKECMKAIARNSHPD